MKFWHGFKKWTDRQGHEVPQVPIQAQPLVHTIPREIAEEAFKEYAAQFGDSQTFEHLHERGGFCSSELMMLLYDRLKRLEAEV